MLIKDCNKYKEYYERFYGCTGQLSDVAWLIDFAKTACNNIRSVHQKDLYSKYIFENACYISAIFKKIGQLLDVELLENNYWVIQNICNIYSMDLDFIFSLAKVDDVTKEDSLKEFREKVKTYLEKKVNNLQLEMPKENTNEFFKILYLALMNKLSRDTYLLSHSNIPMNSNFDIMIGFFEQAKLEYEQKNSSNINELQESKFIAFKLIEFGYGSFKVDNKQSQEVQKCVYNWLISKGYSKNEAYLIIYEAITQTNAKYNPLIDERKYQLSSGKVITFKRSQRYLKQNYEISIAKYLEIVDKIPFEIQNLIDKIIFFDEANIDDLYWKEAYNNCNFYSRASCDYKNRTINFYSTYFCQIITPDVNDVIHEYGHAYDYQFVKDWGIEDELISNSSMWLEAMQNDFELTGNSGVTSYSLYNPCEDFAESFVFAITRPDMLAKFPNRQRLLFEALNEKKLKL